MKEINVQTVSLPASLHLQFHCQCSSLDLESQQHLQTPRSPQRAIGEELYHRIWCYQFLHHFRAPPS